MSTEATDEVLEHLWEIHFHFHLGEPALKLLERICSELVEASVSSSSWQASPFGQAGIRMCTTTTLDELRLIWQRYLSMIRASNAESKDFKKRFTAAAEVKFKNSYDAARDVFPVQVGVAAGGPLWRDFVESGLSRDLYTEYWSVGMVSGWKPVDTVFANPTFAVSSSTKTFPLHHAAEPCHGFDLSVTLAAASSEDSAQSLAQRCASSAREQFNTWSRIVSQGLQAGRIYVRFFAGGAINFCHALQQGGDEAAILLTAPYSSKTLALDEREYRSSSLGRGAPCCFTTIDASHVVDSHGLVTTLFCCEALLEQKPVHSVLYTRTILQRAIQAPSNFTQVLGADASLVSLFVGIAPKPYLDGFTHSVDAAEIAHARAVIPSSTIAAHLAWARTDVPQGNHTLTCDGQKLASLLFEVMVCLTPYDDIGAFVQNVDSSRYEVLCTRAAFVDFLVRVNRSVTPQIWMTTIQRFISLCTNLGDSRNARRSNSYQDLATHLFLRGIDLGLLWR